MLKPHEPHDECDRANLHAKHEDRHQQHVAQRGPAGKVSEP
jgi:hypothetical protein